MFLSFLLLFVWHDVWHETIISPSGFKASDDGFIIFYDLKSEDFSGKVPETPVFDISHEPFDADMRARRKGVILNDGYSSIVKDADSTKWYATNLDNEELEIMFFFKEPIKEWQDIKLKVNWRHMSLENRRNSLFMREVRRIKGVVGVGNGTGNPEDKYYVAIADCMPNINEIVKKVREIEKKYNVSISEVYLYPNYNFLLEEK